eukprot:SAG31_NODE_530_length_14420_cov_4.259968_9_plen_167_part_00
MSSTAAQPAAEPEPPAGLDPASDHLASQAAQAYLNARDDLLRYIRTQLKQTDASLDLVLAPAKESVVCLTFDLLGQTEPFRAQVTTAAFTDEFLRAILQFVEALISTHPDDDQHKAYILANLVCAVGNNASQCGPALVRRLCATGVVVALLPFATKSAGMIHYDTL